MGHRLHHHRVEIAARGGHEARERRRAAALALAQRLHQRSLCTARERQPAAEQLVGDDTEREHVGARIDGTRLAGQLLPAHVRQRAEHLAGARHLRVLVAAGDLGDAEVEHLHLPGFVDKHVARLEIAVDDAAQVRVVDGLADGDHQPKACGQGQLRLLGMVDEIVAAHILHCQIRQAA